ncbi:MAG: GntG family PLP-dependent aldolase [Flavobacteriales bacterium]|nr:aminotransferase class I/II-fold pyridoxal phosphate-dependent enzyme [Flavobacteriales bacterium]
MIDLRSDTVTRPSLAMRTAMAAAEVGDDVFGEDPTVISLEQRVARMFGHEAGVFCPSGTMTNQIAINVHTRPGDEVICEEGAHIYRYEGGGTMANSGCSVKFVPADRGRFTAADVASAINDRGAQWLANSRLVNIENTCNRGGGAVWDLAEVDRIATVCKAHDLALHLDGARIFNALIATGSAAADWGKRFDTASICLSKGLGAPVGSVLIGTRATIERARRIRKRFGGGMRQAGILAAAGSYALDHHVERLKDDHERARRIGSTLERCKAVLEVMPVETNIIIFSLRQGEAAALCAALKEKGILALAIAPQQIRMITHLDVDDAAIDRTTATLQDLLK